MLGKYFVVFKILYQIILCLCFSISFGPCYHPSLSCLPEPSCRFLKQLVMNSRILLFLCKMADPRRPIPFFAEAKTRAMPVSLNMQGLISLILVKCVV